MYYFYVYINIDVTCTLHSRHCIVLLMTLNFKWQNVKEDFVIEFRYLFNNVCEMCMKFEEKTPEH